MYLQWHYATQQNGIQREDSLPNTKNCYAILWHMQFSQNADCHDTEYVALLCFMLLLGWHYAECLNT